MPRAKQKYTTIVPLGYSEELRNSGLPPLIQNKLARLAFALMARTQLTEERREQGHYIRLSWAAGERMFGSRYWSEVLKAAKATGLVDRNHVYSTGYQKNGYKSFPKSIRVADKYRTGEFEVFELTRKTRAKEQAATELGKVETWLAAKLPMFRLPDEIKGKDLWSAFSIECIRQSQYFATICEYGRLHTNFTSLAKYARERLYCGVPLVHLDIKNSQPLILGCVLRGLADPGELREWIKLGEAGLIYEWALEAVQRLGVAKQRVRLNTKFAQIDGEQVLVRRAREWEEDITTWTRDDIKKSTLVMLFSKTEEMRENPVYRAIQRELPSIAQAMAEIKKGNYQTLAHKCQRFESDLMIRGVGSAVMNELEDTPAYTVHDSWTVPLNSSPVVKNAINTLFSEQGINPSIQEEHNNNTPSTNNQTEQDITHKEHTQQEQPPLHTI